MKNRFLYIKEQCEDCGGKGYVWEKVDLPYLASVEKDPIQCSCLKKMALYTSLQHANVPDEYFDLTMDDFKTDTLVDKIKIKNDINKIIADPNRFFNEGRNIFFFGPNGTGKTMLAVEILKAALAKKHTIYYDFYPIICEEFSKKGYKSDDVKDKYDKIFSEVDFLVIDEVTKESSMSAGDRDASRRLLELHILKKRGNKSTFFLANIYDTKKQATMSTEDAQAVINARYGVGVVSMLSRKYKFINVWDEDFRGKK